MPRKSPYKVVLSNAERKQLRLMARRYTSAYFQVVRARIVLLATEGMDNKKTGKRLDMPRQIVSKWRKRFYEKRRDGLEDEPRSGRPADFSPSGGRAGQGSGL